MRTQADLLLGLLADTHCVFDPAAAAALRGVTQIIHAGDVGHHGGHAEVLKAFADATCAPVLAVSGNVDDVPGAAQLLPSHRVIDAAGWKLLLLHIVAPGPSSKVDSTAAALISKHRPDLVVFGHSHKSAHWQADGIHYINPGSAGPARFKLKRSVAKLWLPQKASSDATLQLAMHAPDPSADAIQCLEQICDKSTGLPHRQAPQHGAKCGDGDQKLLDVQAGVSTAVKCAEQQLSQHGWLEFVQLPQKAPPRLKVCKQ